MNNNSETLMTLAEFNFFYKLFGYRKETWIMISTSFT